MKISWYKKYNTWKTVIGVCTPIVSGEALAYFNGITLPVWVHVVVGIISVAVLFIKMFAKDENKNGIIDAFDKPNQNQNNEST